MRRGSLLLVLSLIGGVALCAGCAKDLVTGKSTLNYYNLSQEPKLGEQVLTTQLQALQKKEKKVDAAADGKDYELIKEIVKRIAAVSHYPDFPYEVHIADVDIVNAWCAPGGKIMVYTGLWDPKKGLVHEGNADELAAVLAHEIAHANARHVTEAISRNMTIMMVGTAVQTAIGAAGAGAGADLFGQVFSEGMNIYVPSYSRKSENEADRIGLDYMAMAGYDPRVAVELWKRAAKRKKDSTNIYASHPASGDRVRNLERELPAAMLLYAQALAKEGKKVPVLPGYENVDWQQKADEQKVEVEKEKTEKAKRPHRQYR